MSRDVTGVSAELSDRELRDAVLANRSADALSELISRDPADLAPVLSSVLADPDQPPQLRVRAAAGLGRRRAPEHQESLIAALGDPEPEVRRRAGEALGRIGDERALDALRESAPTTRAVERSARFARTLIAYRLGLDRERLAEPARVELLELGRDAVPIRVEDPPPELPTMEGALRRHVPGVALSLEAPLGLGCESDSFVVLAAETDALASPHASAVLGAVLELLEGPLELACFLYLLSHPRPDGTLALFGLVDGGPVALAGSIEPGEPAAFELRATREWTMPPLLVTGSYRPQPPRIRLTEARIARGLADEQRRRIRQPRRTRAPRPRAGSGGHESARRRGAGTGERGEGDMLRTRFCELLGIEAPVMQAAIWPATAPELVAAVSEAGGLGSIGAVFSSAEEVGGQVERVRQLTGRPFAVNHVVPLLDEQAFAATLEARPAAVSFALGDPVGLVERVHAAGAKAIHQVHTASQARQAAERGVDVVIAQGSEAGGQGMAAGVGALALVPQVVDAVDPIPVLAAGGVADGRGLAAALVLGAAGANVGTRFLASAESGAEPAWQRLVVDAESEQAVRFETWAAIMPPGGGYDVVPRVLRTDFVARWEDRRDEAASQAERLRSELVAAIRERRPHELTPFTGQTAGLVHDVRPAAEIVRGMVAEAERALGRAEALRGR